MEAAVTFRYANLLYNETTNYEHMEQVLSKGVSTFASTS